MSKKLDEMTREELGKLFPIIISEPNPDWVSFYLTEKELILATIGPPNIVRIHHIGSTAIPNIHAKPTIDILLEVVDDIKIDELIFQFQSIGYHYSHQPEKPPPQLMFMKGYTPNGFVGQAYHVHLRYAGDWDELYFRDYLRQHPDIAQAYGELKLKLQKEHQFDREAYTEGKTDFVRNITAKAREVLGKSYNFNQ
ncbi:MAG TPA: GrpB family protein [Bacillota bacterium]|nr:GrpB family protein [Bacillota bacterium]HOL11114.1 GrpB family protein [Bacillota bacterium]HPO98839.1 GrpB family protein [Bacillota bacterium]